MPSTLLLTAALDPLRDEGERYADKLRQHGVDVDLVRCEGLIHGFLSLTHRVPEAGREFERIVESISAHSTGPLFSMNKGGTATLTSTEINMTTQKEISAPHPTRDPSHAWPLSRAALKASDGPRRSGWPTNSRMSH